MSLTLLSESKYRKLWFFAEHTSFKNRRRSIAFKLNLNGVDFHDFSHGLIPMAFQNDMNRLEPHHILPGIERLVVNEAHSFFIQKDKVTNLACLTHERVRIVNGISEFPIVFRRFGLICIWRRSAVD